MARIIPRLAHGSASLGARSEGRFRRGRSTFAILVSTVKWHPERLIFFAFDLLSFDGDDLRSQPIEERRAKLKKLVKDADPRLAYSEEFEGDGGEFFKAAEEHGLEGIVSKRKAVVTRAAPRTPG
jgi:bifunctional non-homologous end joining protein LigD